MHTTVILEPLHVDENVQYEIYVQLQSRINTYLQELGTDGKDITYPQFYKCFITQEQLMLALCSTKRKCKLFLQMNVKDIHINAYIKDLVMAWQANYDI